MKILKMLCTVVLIAGVASTGLAEAVKREARIVDIDGDASIKRLGEKEWLPAESDMTLTEGDMIKTGPDSWALLSLEGIEETASATVEIEEGSQLLFAEFVKDEAGEAGKTLLDLAIGELMITVEKLEAESKFEVKTPTSVTGVRGTKFSVKVEALE